MPGVLAAYAFRIPSVAKNAMYGPSGINPTPNQMMPMKAMGANGRKSRPYQRQTPIAMPFSQPRSFIDPVLRLKAAIHIQRFTAGISPIATTWTQVGMGSNSAVADQPVHHSNTRVTSGETTPRISSQTLGRDNLLLGGSGSAGGGVALRSGSWSFFSGSPIRFKKRR